DGVEHLLDAPGADDRAREHHQHERAHHDGHQDLQQVLHERGQRAHLHQAGIHPVAAEPEHGGGGQVQHHGDGRAHDHEQPADPHRGVGEGGVGGLEAGGLVPLPHEGAHYADPYDLLSHHGVDRVDVVLHPLEQRHQPRGQEAHDHHQDRHRDPHQPGQPRILLDRHDDPTDGHDRDHHHEVQRHQHQHLHLLDVVEIG